MCASSNVNVLLLEDGREHSQIVFLHALAFLDGVEETTCLFQRESQLSDLGERLLLRPPGALATQGSLLLVARSEGDQRGRVVVSRRRPKLFEQCLPTLTPTCSPEGVGSLNSLERDVQVGLNVKGAERQGLGDDVQGDEFFGVGGLLLKAVHEHFELVFVQPVGRAGGGVVLFQPLEVLVIQVVFDEPKLVEGSSDRHLNVVLGLHKVSLVECCVVRRLIHDGSWDVGLDAHLRTFEGKTNVSFLLFFSFDEGLGARLRSSVDFDFFFGFIHFFELDAKRFRDINRSWSKSTAR